MKEFNKNKEITDVSSFNDYASQLFENFLEGFTKENGLIRDIIEGDWGIDDEWGFVYTRKGQRLAEEMQRRLYAVGEAHFPEDDMFIEISSMLYQEN